MTVNFVIHMKNKYSLVFEIFLPVNLSMILVELSTNKFLLCR